MKTAFILILCLVSVNLYSQSGSNPRKISYCSAVGPVELTFDAGKVSGTYIITVTPEPIPGTLTGTIEKGLLRGKWSDKDGIGDIIFGFDPTLSRFHAIYNTAEDASNWYNQWQGISSNLMTTLSAHEQKRFICSTKK